MKLQVLIIILTSIFTSELFGQMGQKKTFEYGVIYSPTITFAPKIKRPPVFNFSTGVYTKYFFKDKISVGIGLEYQRQNINTIKRKLCDPHDNLICDLPSQDKLEVIKIPILLNLNLNSKIDPKIKADFVGGYAYGKLLNSDKKSKEYQLHGLVDNLHFGIVGIEFQRKIVGGVKLTIGSHFELINIYDEKYGGIQNLKFILRISGTKATVKE